jgi:hypothetical protein
MAALNPEISLAKTQPSTQKPNPLSPNPQKKPPNLHPKNPLPNPAQKAKYFGAIKVVGLGEIG